MLDSRAVWYFMVLIFHNIFIDAYCTRASVSKYLLLQSYQASLPFEFYQLYTMQAQFNVKSTVGWAVDYTTVLWHTNPIEIGITTPSLKSGFYWDLSGVLLRFLEFYTKEMLNNQQLTAPI